MGGDEPVKQADAARYLGVTKGQIKATFHHGFDFEPVDRTGAGEGLVATSDCQRALAQMGVVDKCATCGCPLGKDGKPQQEAGG